MQRQSSMCIVYRRQPSPHAYSTSEMVAVPAMPALHTSIASAHVPKICRAISVVGPPLFSAEFAAGNVNQTAGPKAAIFSSSFTSYKRANTTES